MIWIDKQAPLDQALASVAAQPVVAVDTEADSLHSYFDKVCLIQISAGADDLVIDPLAGVDLKRFGEVLANPAITKRSCTAPTTTCASSIATSVSPPPTSSTPWSPPSSSDTRRTASPHCSSATSD